MTAPRKPHPIENLPFVFDRAAKSRTNVRRCFWHVEPTGRYDADCSTGERFAVEYLHYAADENSNLLAHIVKDMPRETTGIEVGFLQLIGFAAQYGLPQAEQLLRYWEREGRRRTHGALVSQRLDGSVLIEQPDGTRKVYRPEQTEAGEAA
jgi:hypothetical protein